MRDRTLNTRQLILRIMTIISVVEFSIMNSFVFFHIELHPVLEAAVDTILLSLLSTPLLYVWVLRPYRESSER